MMDQEFKERRRETECISHGQMTEMITAMSKNMVDIKTYMTNMDSKLDTVVDRQIAYVAKTERLEAIVTNGLSTTVREIKDRLEVFHDEMCTNFQAHKNNFVSHGDRLMELEKFSWFRTWVTQARDDLFKNIMKLIGLGGLLYLLFHFGEEFIKKVIL